MLTKPTEMLEQKSTSILLDLLYFSKLDTESYREIVGELWRRDGDPFEAAHARRDELIGQVHDFHDNLVRSLHDHAIASAARSTS